MKNKSVRLMVLGMLIVLALLVIVPAASASMVTKIMYAQENVETFVYTPTVTGDLYIECSWLDHLGNASSYPTSEVDVGVHGPSGNALYKDFDIGDLYTGINPVSSTLTVTKAKTYYISVFPYVEDCAATLTVKFGGDTGTNVTMTRTSDGASVTSPQTVAAYASDGEVFLPGAGAWIDCFQYWPGTAAEYYANWNDYVYERTDATAYDTLAELYDSVFYQTPTGYQTVCRQSVSAAGGADPSSQKWYLITPEIWPAAAVPNVVDPAGNVKPSFIAATKAPAWYTYAYEDAGVAGQAAGYFWSSLTMPTASKRNFSMDVATGASLGASFSGDSITWVFPKTTASGIARVTIDGTDKGTVDQYAGAFAPKQTAVFNGLGAGDHTIVITNTATKNGLSSNTFINHDAFLAKSKGDASDPTPWMENNYDGATWYKWSSLTGVPAASGGGFSMNVATSATLACEFTGTSVTWKYLTNSASGIARVYIDGVDKGTVDQFSASPTFQVTKAFTGLANTTHIIMIANTGTKNTASSNTFINHDAFIYGATTVEN
jgi:hypothetical protein